MLTVYKQEICLRPRNLEHRGIPNTEGAFYTFYRFSSTMETSVTCQRTSNRPGKALGGRDQCKQSVLLCMQARKSPQSLIPHEKVNMARRDGLEQRWKECGDTVRITGLLSFQLATVRSPATEAPLAA